MAFIATQNGDSYISMDMENNPQERRKLILHFDIRNTVLVADSVTNVSMEQALNSFLTGVVWGQEYNIGQWEWYSYEPSLSPPCKNALTYYKHLEKSLVKTPSDRTMLRLATGYFTSDKIGKPFRECFEHHLEALRWRYELEPDHNIMTMSGKDGKPYHYLLKSVYRVIHHLVETNRDFAIIFRTYGLDAPNVIASLSHGLQGNHPDYPRSLDMKINKVPGLVSRSDDGSIVFQVAERPEGSDVSKMSEYRDDRAIYDMLSSSEGISGFKDAFIYWQDNSYHYDTAKPLYIDPFDDKAHHIFFDDNIRTIEDDSIVNVRMFETKNSTTAKSLHKTEVEKFEDMCLVQADLLQAIHNDDYFVDCVNKCERNYEQFLHRYRVNK